MNASFKTIAALCSVAMMMNTGCANGSTGSDTGVTPLLNGDASQNDSSIVPAVTDEKDSEPAQTATCKAAFSASGVKVTGTGASAAGNTLTITAAGVYEITGECTAAKIIIDADKESEVSLLLNGVNLTSADGSVILCEKAGKLIITSADGSDNRLSDSESYTLEADADEPDAAVFSRCDTVINGAGSLSVTGNYSAAIRCKDGLKICSTNLSVKAANDGIKGKDYLIVSESSINIECGGDGMKSTNNTDEILGYVNIRSGEITITSGNDAVQAETELIVDGGSITAVTGGGSASVEQKSSKEFGWGDKFSFGGDGFDFDSMTDTEGSTAESMKALKAGRAIIINGGELNIDSADDALHSNGDLTVSGGSLRISTGDDGLYADQNVTVNDGNINILTCYEGIEGMSIDINGGTIDLCAYDDGFNAAGGDNGALYGFGSDSGEHYLSISGGSITVNAEGDGLDSNGSMAMSGGVVVVFGPTGNGNGALDYDSSFAVSGGTLIALGSAGMAQAPSTLSQPCIAVNASVSADSTIEVRDAEDNVVLSVETPKNCQSLIFTSDKLTSGSTYTVYAAGTALETVTVTDGVTGSGANGGMGGFGGKGGRGDKNIGGMAPPEGFEGDAGSGFDPSQKPTQFDAERPNDFGGRGNRDEIPEGARPGDSSAEQPDGTAA